MEIQAGRADRILLTCCLLAVSALGVVGCTGHPSDTAPEYFGLYYQGPKGLKEIPLSGDPSYVAASKEVKNAMANRSVEQVKVAMKGIYTSCEQASPKPTFIVYRNDLQPQMFHLSQVRPSVKQVDEVDLGVAPVANKPDMYRLTPKQPLSPGFYILAAVFDTGRPQLDCFLVGMTPEEMLKASQ